jgi:hypothetical protein
MMLLGELRQFHEFVFAQRAVIVGVEFFEEIFGRWKWWAGGRANSRTIGTNWSTWATIAGGTNTRTTPLSIATVFTATPVAIGAARPIAFADQFTQGFAGRLTLPVAHVPIAIFIEQSEKSLPGLSTSRAIACRALALRRLRQRGQR